MPARDHFENPTRREWQRLHGMWPAVIIQHLVPQMPPRYTLAPQIQLGQYFEIDIATYDEGPNGITQPHSGNSSGGTATAVWTSPKPTLSLETEMPEADEYEVLIYDAENEERLVAAIELVSPSNKDRPDTRAAFVAKCAELVRNSVCVSIVDLVTVRQFNLYTQLLDTLGHADPSMNAVPLYGVTVRRCSPTPRTRLEMWAHPIRIGEPLPSLPIWLSDGEGLMLDLEATYEETCRTLKLAR